MYASGNVKHSTLAFCKKKTNITRNNSILIERNIREKFNSKMQNN